MSQFPFGRVAVISTICFGAVVSAAAQQPKDRYLESSAPPARIRVDGTVQATKLVHKVDPTYPENAKKAHIEGTVALHAVIAADGSMEELEVISGDDLLIQAALAAVRYWKYQQTFRNGEAVEVETVISIIFSPQ
jgi:periplasmic protein TonB